MRLSKGDLRQSVKKLLLAHLVLLRALPNNKSCKVRNLHFRCSKSLKVRNLHLANQQHPDVDQDTATKPLILAVDRCQPRCSAIHGSKAAVFQRLVLGQFHLSSIRNFSKLPKVRKLQLVNGCDPGVDQYTNRKLTILPFDWYHPPFRSIARSKVAENGRSVF